MAFRIKGSLWKPTTASILKLQPPIKKYHALKRPCAVLAACTQTTAKMLEPTRGIREEPGHYAGTINRAAIVHAAGKGWAFLCNGGEKVKIRV
jgi:hypothetical protein